MEAQSDHEITKQYNSLYTFTTSIGLGMICLIIFWIFNYRGGLADSSNPKVEFNWHPILMTISLIFLYSQSILLYRSFRMSKKRTVKIAHAVIHGLAFIIAVIGIQTAFDSHNLASPPVSNLYTLHSWLGLAAIVIFAGQFALGFVVYLFPSLSKNIKRWFMPIHTGVGAGGFVLAVAAASTGMVEKTLWSVNNAKYQKYVTEGMVCNTIGLLTIFYGILVLHLVKEAAYRRLALPEDEMVLTENE